MLDDGVLDEAYALMSARALKSVRAIEAAVDPVARLWCRSFGVLDEEAVRRLKLRLADAVVDAVAGGVSLDALQERLDEAAEQAIRTWFAAVLGEAVAPTAQALAIVRLAFLEANTDQRWSSGFLKPDVAAHALAAEVRAVMIQPTPQARFRRMERQVL